MRRITVSCLTLTLILLGLTGLAAAQNVSIQLTPIAYPIVLPDSGGTFDYLLFVTNQDSTPVTAAIWCMITLPNGDSWGPVVGPATRTLGAGQTQSYHRTQNVPRRAPYGYYTLRACVGIYPDTIWAQDQFEFQHQAVSGTEQEWVARYDGPGNFTDIPNSISIDDFDNVYVSGQSFGVATDYDYCTIKYNWDGSARWIARYNSPGNGEDIASCIAVDDSGNVYVTGGAGIPRDYTTIKYSSEGIAQWVACYNGPENGWDLASSVAVDDSGNVFVTGYSWGGSALGYDFATVRYDSAGVEQWAVRYNGPGNGEDRAYEIAVDISGNVYVSGRSTGIGTSGDYCTIKYSPGGFQQWAARYSGLGGNYLDQPSSMVVDSLGNVYVTGSSNGNLMQEDYATIKYNSAGVELWVARYDGPANYRDLAYSMAIDGSGNIYVTGESAAGIWNYDFATISYNSAGVEQWVARYNGPGNYNDGALAIALDELGSVYVTGYSWGGGTSDDYATIMYNAAGAQQWVVRYNGPANEGDVARTMAVGASAIVYVTGSSDALHGIVTDNLDFATIKYSGGNLDNWMPVEATVLGQSAWGGPQEFALRQNYPNPFNASTVLSYQLPVSSHVSLRVYDTAGRLVETLVDGWRAAGTHELTFDASELPSGMYVYRIQAGEWTDSGKMILLK